jgi:hypothetical protein
MATSVYDIVDLELSNGEILQIRPLPIKPLRKFMAVIEKLDSIENEAEALDIFIEAGMICVSYFNQELAKDKDTFEDVIEVPTLMKILEVAGGLKLNDPNLLGAALVGAS